MANQAYEGVQRAEQYLAALPVGESLLRSRISSTLSYLLDRLGQNQRALEFAEGAVVLARASCDDPAVASALMRCTFPKLRLGRIGEVAVELDEVEALACARGVPEGNQRIR